MKGKIKHRSSVKAKNSAQIHMLEGNLFSKLEEADVPPSKLDEFDVQMLQYPQDSLTDLIGRAKGITFNNQDKIQKAKRQLRVSKQEAVGTFLTGTGMYIDESKQQQIGQFQPSGEEPDSDSMLKELVRRDGYDDLAELRRMIKITGDNLDDYERKVFKTKKQVESAANHFNSQMDFNLTCKLNKFGQTHTKKMSSVARLNRYK